MSKKMMRVRLEEHELTWNRLPPAFDGFRILQLSDLHFAGPAKGRELAVEAYLEATKPDAVIITGDLANRPGCWAHVEDWLGSLSLPAMTYAVPGNWEYKTGVDAASFSERMARLGLKPLCNASEELRRGDQSVHMLGFDDVRDGTPDLDEAFEQVPDAAFRIGLCHNPDILLSAPPERFDLLVCGHTHGGQICLPGWGAIYTSTKLGKRFESGLYEPVPEHYVYVSRGIGTVNLSWRLFCPAEVALFTLTRGRDDGEDS